MLMEVLYAKWYNSIQGNWMQKIGGQLHEETLSLLYKGQEQENVELRITYVRLWIWNTKSIYLIVCIDV